MIKSKTVFVVGAGASKEVKLPIGAELTTKIARLLGVERGAAFNTISDNTIERAIQIKTQSYPGRHSLYKEACQRISGAMPIAPSIDNFIDSQQGDEEVEFCAKIAIVRSILTAERQSDFYFDNSNIYNTMSFEKQPDIWYRHLWFLLCADVSRNNVESIFDNIVFVIFNYDRCVEHFLCEALKRYYNLDAESVRNVMSKLKIYHPYGQVGLLPAMSATSRVSYGVEPTSELLIALAGQIKTFTERVDEAGELAAFRQEIATAQKIVFLGFAFHEINMKLLQTGADQGNWGIYGTRYGVSDSDAGVIAGRIRGMFVKLHGPDMLTHQEMTIASYHAGRIQQLPVNLHRGTCTQLFNEYGMSIG